MPKQTVGRTALGATVCRLIEQYQPEETRLFDDPVVKGSGNWSSWLRASTRAPTVCLASRTFRCTKWTCRRYRTKRRRGC